MSFINKGELARHNETVFLQVREIIASLPDGNVYSERLFETYA
jgi:hypothetical protein